MDSNDEAKNMPPPYDGGDPPPVIHQPTAPTVVMMPQQMGSKPSGLICPSCRQQITTRVEYKSSTKTHLFAVILCLICFPCVCVPYCTNSCQNADHYCPNCNAYIGSYSN